MRLAARAAQEFPRLGSPETVWNIGSIILRPGAPNVVPNAGEMVIEFRDTDPAVMDALERELRQWVDELGRGEYAARMEPMALIAPTPLSKELGVVLAASSEALGEEPMHMPSGAGHDAMVVGRFIPATMLFVPSIGGRSHDITEDTAEADIVFGCEVLADAADKLLANPDLIRSAP
jgi:N-carbamoyl-L-amino-acid hydrolase